MAAELACEMELAGVGGCTSWPAPQHAAAPTLHPAAELAGPARWSSAAVLAALVSAAEAPPISGDSAMLHHQASVAVCSGGAVHGQPVFGTGWPVLPPSSPGAADLPAMPSLLPLESGCTASTHSRALAPASSFTDIAMASSAFGLPGAPLF